MLNNITAARRFNGFEVSSASPIISHLQYAYDTIIFCRAVVDEVCNVVTFLRCCEPALGLKVNFQTTCIIGIICTEELVSSFTACVDCRVESFPIKYLGLPILDSRLPRNV
ncbi:hypothetical protein AMTRI_Chr11g97890 [Amborella trichopoda]